MRHFTTFLFFSSFIAAYSQTDEENLEKYWKFRNNFRTDFVKIGIDRGESVPLNAYRPNWACADFGGGGPDGQSGSLKWGDAPSRIGFYLMMLSTEYRLLKDQNKDVTSVLNEIYYALNTFNRLDLGAEQYLTQGAIPASLDGYYIRDDVPEDAYINFVEYNNEEYKCVDSDFFGRDNVDNVSGGPFNLVYETYRDFNFPSKDQLSGILPGLAFVVKFVDNEFVKPTSTDLGFNIVDEARVITDRYISYLQNHNWFYKDKLTLEPVNNGGGDLALESYPVAIIGNRITGNGYFTNSIPRSLKDYNPSLPNIFNQGTTISASDIAGFWQTDMPFWYNNGIVNWECMTPDPLLITIKLCPFVENAQNTIVEHNINTVLIWATFANLWDKATIHTWSEGTGFNYIDLAYALYNDETPYSPISFYKQILDDMECEGPYANRLSDGTIVPAPGGWAAENRWIKPNYAYTGSSESGQHGTYSALDYMLFHNMYYLAFKDQLPPFEEKYSCQCNDEVISSSVSTLITPVIVTKKFQDYYDKKIDEMHFLSHNMSVENGGEIVLETDLTICNGSVISLINNGFITTSNSLNNRYGNLYVTDGSTLELSTDGILLVKSGTEVVIDKNSFLKISELGKLHIEDNAKVIIKPEGTLIIDKNSIIELAGNNAILEIQGNIEVKDDAVFTFQGDGFVKWNTLYQPNSNVIAGINSQIKFEGNSRTDKVLEISGENGSSDCWMPDNLTLFEVNQGLVEFTANGRLVLPCPMSLVASNFQTSITPFVNSRGV